MTLTIKSTEADVMRKLLNETAEAQRTEDDRLAARTFRVAEEKFWDDVAARVAGTYGTETLALMNTMQAPNHIAFLKELHKNCKLSCGYKKLYRN